MSVTLLRNPTKEDILEHVDDLLNKIKDHNKKNSLQVVKVVIAGNVLQTSKSDTTIFLQFKDKVGEISPPILALDNNFTNLDKEKYLTNERVWFDQHNFLISNYVKIKSLAELEVCCPRVDQAKIILSENMRSSPELKQSLGIKKDYFTEKKLNFHITNIAKKFKK